jgi:hypothetical protein
VERSPDGVTSWFDWPAEPGVTYRCERLVALHTSGDAQDPRAAAVRHAGRLGALGPGRLAQEHRRRWAERWWAGRRRRARG